MRIFLTCLALLSLSACGFEAVHAKRGNNQPSQIAGNINVSDIAVTTGRGRLQQLLKAEIQDRINPSLGRIQPRYRLAITTNETNQFRFINPDGTPSRGDIVFTTSYTLTELATNQVIDSGAINRTSSYNTNEAADYATFVTLEDAKVRGIIELAQSYALRLSNVRITAKEARP